MKNVFIITATLFIAGCASGVTVEQYKNADYGQKLEQSRYNSYIHQSVSRTLVDPDSIKMTCTDAKKGWAKDPGFNKPKFGWVVYCEINAKNRFGGYAGAKSYVYLFNGEKVMVSLPDGYASRGHDFDFMP